VASNATSENMGSVVFNIGSSWHGFSAIKNIVVFGASYCAVRKDPCKSGFLHPTKEQPLGVEFPGVAFAEPGTPNWVGHLVTKYAPRGEMLAYCYAVGGAMVDGVNNQIRNVFPLEVGKDLKSERAPRDWDPTNTLFVTWVGINDCAFGGDIQAKMLTLETAHQHLYAAGARNFLFINLPPIERSPSALSAKRREERDRATNPLAPKAIDRSQTFKKWNQELERYVRLFANSHPKEITAMIYSSYDTFNRVLDHPELHGFTLEDIDRKGSSIWHDDIHPTSAMHDIIARDIVRLLDDQRPLAGEQVSATS